jgi:kynureninase
MHCRPDEAYAIECDRADPLRHYRDEFCIPRRKDVGAAGDSEAVYLAGNSLGLMPRAARGAVEQELDDWARLGVEGHFHARHPWYPYHEEVRAGLAGVVGALEREVVAMNSLTVNLHLLMATFYHPTRHRHTIVVDSPTFPSDSYAVQSQVRWHARHLGFDASLGVLRLMPREGEATLNTDDILETIDRRRAEIALLLLSAVNYLTGQVLDIRTITSFARSRGIVVGWDLAHAAGNLALNLHDDGPDFAAWCSYKYLNAGPGAVAGAFVHERHLDNPSLVRLAGWWGNDPATRFRMETDFVPVASADAWSLSNPPILAMAPLRVSLELFARAGMCALRDKSAKLAAYLAGLVDAINRRRATAGLDPIRVLTPPDSRACQLSLVLPGDGREAYNRLRKAGIVADFREPNVVRLAPVPLYNSFHDVWLAGQALEASL